MVIINIGTGSHTKYIKLYTIAAIIFATLNKRYIRVNELTYNIFI
jgi:hypothetical protein